MNITMTHCGKAVLKGACQNSSNSSSSLLRKTVYFGKFLISNIVTSHSTSV